MAYKLRPYQEKATQDILTYLENTTDARGVAVLPVAAGKSLIIAETARRLNSTVLVLQPSQELLKQNYEKYTSYGNPASIFSASLNSREVGQVTFGTIGTVKSAVHQFKNIGLKYIIVDECHLGSKHGGQLKLFLEQMKIKKLVGLTATPLELRSGMYGAYLQIITRSRKNLFKDIVHVTQIPDIVSMGFWANIDYDYKQVDTSSLVLNSNKSDFTDASQKKFYASNNLYDKVYKEVINLLDSGRKSILVFMPGIAESDYMALKLNQLEIPCKSVHSKMDKKERVQAVDGFKSGKIKVVTNVNVLSVGFDHPELDAIIMARPTNSFAVYYQQAGRGVRIHPSKKDVKLVDYSDNTARFGRMEEIEFIDTGNGKWDMFNKTHRLTQFVEYRDVILNPQEVKVFWFGRYTGKSVEEVVEKDPHYIHWMLNSGKFSWSSDKLLSLKQSIEKIYR